MKIRILILFLVILFLTISCSNNKYSDGNYCAEVEYYNPNTRTRSTYKLPVEIKDSKLTVIRFPNGGMLRSTHFIPPKIENGKASFVSDRKYRYSVKILNKGKCNYD